MGGGHTHGENLTTGTNLGEIKTPGDSARRSRRGYWYQDVHALDRCLETLGERWDEVIVEGREDVTCLRNGSRPCEQHEQVKTVEAPKQLWSIALLCAGENGKIDRSILGKLFLGKALHDDVVFVLVLNEGVGDDIRVLTKAPDDRKDEDVLTCHKALCQKLEALSVPEGYTVDWFVERLSIEVRARTIEELEALVIARLAAVIQSQCQERPLNDEVDTVFSLVMEKLTAEARGPKPQAFNADTVSAIVKEAFGKIDRSPDALPANQASSRLRAKVTPLGFDEPAITNVVAMHLEHRRGFRRADRARQSVLQAMVDDVFAACSVVAARRNAGQIAPGADTYAATEDALRELHTSGNYAALGFTVAELRRAMWDITSRCQHRFSS